MIANAKGRIGYAYKYYLLYIAGGWAGNNVEVEMNDFTNNILAKSTKWINGWTIGAGAECKITKNLSLGLEYDYIQQKYKNENGSCPLCGTGVGFGSPVFNNSIQSQTLLARISFYL